MLIYTAGRGKTSIILALVGEEFPLYVSVVSFACMI